MKEEIYGSLAGEDTMHKVLPMDEASILPSIPPASVSTYWHQQHTRGTVVIPILQGTTLENSKWHKQESNQRSSTCL